LLTTELPVQAVGLYGCEGTKGVNGSGIGNCSYSWECRETNEAKSATANGIYT